MKLEKINANMIELIEKFNKIKNKGYVEGYNHGCGSVGDTFELLLGKDLERLDLPDYKGIEIKTKSSLYERGITLFDCAPDSSINESTRLKELYGYSDQDYPNFKILYIKINGKIKKLAKSGYYFKLYVNYEEDKVELLVINKYDKIIDRNTSWSFDIIEKKLSRKLSYLAYIEATTKKINGKFYHKYNSIQIYQKRSLINFLNLIRTGVVKISFRVGIRKSGEFIGTTNDHGTAFVIDKENLNKAFKQII